MPLDELSIIDRFFRPLAGEGAFGLRDDAGQLILPRHSRPSEARAGNPGSPDPWVKPEDDVEKSGADGFDIVVTADMIAEGVHFLPNDPPETVAQKALRVNLSDLAAKGAAPLCYVLSLGLGATTDEAWLAAFADGLQRDQQRFGIGLLGGDTIRTGTRPTISITAFGTVPRGRMVHRFGGRPADALYVSGTIGAAALGLALLKNEPGPWQTLPDAERYLLIQRYRVPDPRVLLASVLTQFASAAMDVSDGLVGDCDKLCAASSCSALIDAARVPVPNLRAGGEELLPRLLTSGDDYEILAAIRPEQEEAFRHAAHAVEIPVTRIGALTEGPGKVRVEVEGRPLALYNRSYVHGGSNERP